MLRILNVLAAIREFSMERRLEVEWRHWKYKNTALLLISLVALIYLAGTPLLDQVVRSVGALGYLGAFIVGIFFVSTFTVAPAAVVLFHLAETLHPFEIALLAGLGAMVGDYFIYRFMQDNVFKELWPLFHKLQSPRLKIMFKSPYFAWLLPVFGAMIIASPFPDELGVGLLGASRVKKWQFFLLAFALNTAGVLLVVLSARIVD